MSQSLGELFFELSADTSQLKDAARDVAQFNNSAADSSKANKSAADSSTELAVAEKQAATQAKVVSIESARAAKQTKKQATSASHAAREENRSADSAKRVAAWQKVASQKAKDVAKESSDAAKATQLAAKQANQLAASEKRAANEARKLASASKQASKNRFRPMGAGADMAKAKMGGLIGTVVSLAAALTGVASTGHVLGLVKELDIYAASLDMSAEKLHVFQTAAKMQGLADGADLLKDVTDKFGDFLATGGGEAKDIFERLQLNAEDLISLDPAEKLVAIKNRMDEIGNVSRSEEVFLFEAIANDASKLLPLLDNNQEKLNAIEAQTHKSNVLFDDAQLATIRAANAEMANLKLSASGVSSQFGAIGSLFVAQFAGPISDGLNATSRFLKDLYYQVGDMAAGWSSSYERMAADNESYLSQLSSSTVSGLEFIADAYSTYLFEPSGKLWRNMPVVAELALATIVYGFESSVLSMETGLHAVDKFFTESWENIKWVGEQAWIHIRYSAESAFAGMVTTTASALGVIGTAFAAIGAEPLAAKFDGVSESLRTMAAETTAARDAELSASDARNADKLSLVAETHNIIADSINAEATAIDKEYASRVELARQIVVETEAQNILNQAKRDSSSGDQGSTNAGQSDIESQKQNQAALKAYRATQSKEQEAADAKAQQQRDSATATAFQYLQNSLLTGLEAETTHYDAALQNLLNAEQLQKNALAAGKQSQIETLVPFHELKERLEDEHQQKLAALKLGTTVGKAQSDLDQVVEGLEPPQDDPVAQENAQYADDKAAIVTAREIGLDTIRDYDDIEAEMKAQHDARVVELERQKYAKLGVIQKAQLAAGVDLGTQAEQAEFRANGKKFANMIGQAASFSKEAFQVDKRLKQAQVLVDTPAAIASSFAFGAKIGGPPVGAVFAGIAGAFQAAQLSQLESTSFSGRRFGGDTDANTGYNVNETGVPEIYSQGGTDYLMTGASRGKVTPLNKYFQDNSTTNNAAPTQVVVNNTFSVINASSRVSVEEVETSDGSIGALIVDLDTDGEAAKKIRDTFGLRRVGT